MLTVGKKVIFPDNLLLILQTIDCNTETNDDFCVDENKDDLYIYFSNKMAYQHQKMPFKYFKFTAKKWIVCMFFIY